MKVFITGIGSDLGTQIARMLEKRSEVTDIVGVDLYPPRRYLARTQFFMTKHDDSERIAEVIAHTHPDVIINFGLYEPGARLGATRAQEATHASVSGIIHGIKSRDIPIITRSSVVAYGFSDPHRVKDETTPLSPDTHYGEMCRYVEEQLMQTCRYVTVIRTAPELSAHVPHPLARLLHMPALPVPLRNPFAREVGFPLISSRDAISIFVEASLRAVETMEMQRVLHAATAHNATMLMAVREGKKIPIVTHPWAMPLAKKAFYVAGAPIADHVEKLIMDGMTIDSTSTRMHLGITAQDSPSYVLHNLYHSPLENDVIYEGAQ